MLNIEQMVQSARACLGWPYVSPGSNDEKGIDCSGLFVKIFKDQGSSIYHGSNTIFRQYCVKTGKLTSESQLQPGMAVFKLKAWKDSDSDNRWYNTNPGNLSHIGIVTSVSPLEIIHASTGPMCVTTDKKIGTWKYWGTLKNVDYGGSQSVEPTQKEVTIVVEYAKVIGGGLNMREAESTSSNKITQIPNGATVAVVEHKDKWCKVTYNDYTGYVMTEYLSFNNSDGDQKESKLMLSIPRDCALALYEALKYSLKL